MAAVLLHYAACFPGVEVLFQQAQMLPWKINRRLHHSRQTSPDIFVVGNDVAAIAPGMSSSGKRVRLFVDGP
jgi:hypothetical protein